MFKRWTRNRKIRSLRKQEQRLLDILACEQRRRAKVDQAIARCRQQLAQVVCALYGMTGTLSPGDPRAGITAALIHRRDFDFIPPGGRIQ